jgi:phosphoribosylformylglycinamidine cyclo-ligase
MAEMPGFYPPGEYDLAGFAVGMVDKAAIIDGTAIKDGDVLIGLASSGLHSNGYSLARRVLLEGANMALTEYQTAFKSTLSEELLKPTNIYVRPVLKALGKFTVKGMAHITGGGLPGNLPRILPEGLKAEIDARAWPVPPVFSVIEELGSIERDEMFRVFNMGIGYVLVVPETEATAMIDYFNELVTPSYLIGKVVGGTGEVSFK